MKVLFDTRRIQKLGRVSLSEQLLRNAGLHEGDQVDLYFDAATKRIIIEPAAPNDAQAVSEKSVSGRKG
jgi:bifunctional DNA-binding transcriptional regulator/antitoxin component of YhaV-PrlF toxin-antitoxin module